MPNPDLDFIFLTGPREIAGAYLIVRTECSVHVPKDANMTRFLSAAAAAALLIGSTAAYAAAPVKTTPISHPSASSTTATNYTTRCAALAGEWKTAEEGHLMSANLGKARADATKGAKLCKSTSVTEQKRGAASYEAALKSLGVTPT